MNQQSILVFGKYRHSPAGDTFWLEHFGSDTLGADHCIGYWGWGGGSGFFSLKKNCVQQMCRKKSVLSQKFKKYVHEGKIPCFVLEMNKIGLLRKKNHSPPRVSRVCALFIIILIPSDCNWQVLTADTLYSNKKYTTVYIPFKCNNPAWD